MNHQRKGEVMWVCFWTLSGGNQ